MVRKSGLDQSQAVDGKGLLWQVIQTCRGALSSTFVFSCLINVLMLTGPLFMLQVYDRILPSSSVMTLLVLGGLTLGLFLYYGFLEFLRARIMGRIGRRVEENLRPVVFDAVAEHALRRTPSVGSQPIQDLSLIRQFLSGQGPFAFFDMLWVPIYLFVNFKLHWLLGVASLVAAILIFVLASISEYAGRKPLAQSTAATLEASLVSDEMRRNSEALHALGMRPAVRDRWVEIQQRALDQATLASDASGILSAMSRAVRLIIQSCILALGAYLAIIHELSPGAMMAASIIMGRALAPVESAVANWPQFLNFRKAIERMNAALKIIKPKLELTKLPQPQGQLQVENLAVALPGAEKPVLYGVSFQMAPGEAIGIIGPSGAGKTTLAKAILGLVPIAQGAVRLDGATFDQYDFETLGQHLGYLPQEPQLFSGTAAQNIARFEPHADSEKIIAAAKLAKIHEFIMRLPQGYDTPLGENGSRLSVGQRQRLALARCLYGNPVLMVLDEPNANLDPEGEVALDHAIRASLQRGAAVIVIAHRPNVLAAMQRVIVLKEGRIAMVGPRDEILSKVLNQPAAAAPAANSTPANKTLPVQGHNVVSVKPPQSQVGH